MQQPRRRGCPYGPLVPLLGVCYVVQLVRLSCRLRTIWPSKVIMLRHEVTALLASPLIGVDSVNYLHSNGRSGDDRLEATATCRE